ncbi:MAG: hypothetical protein V1898_00795 [Patescibacteria group bacterium]
MVNNKEKALVGAALLGATAIGGKAIHDGTDLYNTRHEISQAQEQQKHYAHELATVQAFGFDPRDYQPDESGRSVLDQAIITATANLFNDQLQYTESIFMKGRPSARCEVRSEQKHQNLNAYSGWLAVLRAFEKRTASADQMLSDTLSKTSRENAQANQMDVSTYRVALYEGHDIIQLGNCLLRLWPLIKERLNNLPQSPDSEKEQFLNKLHEQLNDLSLLLSNVGFDPHARYNQEATNSMLAQEETLQYYIQRILQQRADIYHILSEVNPEYSYQQDENNQYIMLGDLAYISQSYRQRGDNIHFAIMRYEKAGATSDAQLLCQKGLDSMINALETNPVPSVEAVDYLLYQYADLSIQAQFSDRLLQVARQSELTYPLVSAEIYKTLGGDNWSDYRRLMENVADSPK